MKASDLINWGELSRYLSGSKMKKRKNGPGSRMTIRRNRISTIHKPFIDDLIKTIDEKIKARIK